MKPAVAPPISMPPKPTNPTIDLKALSTKTKPVALPKVTSTAVPSSPSQQAPDPSLPRVDDIDAFQAYRDTYDDDFPDSLPTAPKPIPGKKAAEWVEVKTRPNYRRGIINLDYATVAQTNAVQSKASQVKESLNRTTTGGPMRKPGQTSGPNTTIITIVCSGGVDDPAEEAAIRGLTEQFIIMSAHLTIEQMTAASIAVVGRWWVVKADKKGNRCYVPVSRDLGKCNREK
jgi:hypothetical protein